MAWKETPRAQAARIRRTYRCADCRYEFKWVHESAEEPLPECPMCVAAAAAANVPLVAAPVAYVPPLVAINGDKSRAIDAAQQMAEQQFGLTDFNDNQRAGDIAFKGPAPMQTAEREQLVREMVQAGLPDHLPVAQQEAAANYWQGQLGAATTEATIGQQSVAAQASQAAASMGVDPVGILEKGRETGSMRPRYDVVASTTAEP